MTVTYTALPLIICLVSAIAVVPIVCLGEKRADLREGVTLLAGLLKFMLVLSLVPRVLGGEVLYFRLAEVVPGIPIAFRVDGLGVLFAIVASLLWIITSLYSIGYMRALKEHGQTRYYSFFALALSSTLGVAFSANLLTLYLFYELLSMSTWPLVTHHQDKEARTGGRKYLTYLVGASIGLLLPASTYVYLQMGGQDIVFDGMNPVSAYISSETLLVLLLMMTFGFAKAGLMPLHSWLPGAMVAPTPVSALLHAVAVVKVGVFCIIRVFTGVFSPEHIAALNIGQVISWIAAFTVIVSSLIALSQDNFKRRLAFSTIGQLSYIILGVSLVSAVGMAGSMLHIAMHAFAKITLFMVCGAVFVATGKKYISQLNGLGRRMPITFVAFFIGALSVIGIPPTGGFVSKMYLLSGTLQAGQTALMVVFLVSSFLNAIYLMEPVYRAFFLSPKDGETLPEGIKEAPLFCWLPPAITAVITIFLFFKPDMFVALADSMTQFIIH